MPKIVKEQQPNTKEIIWQANASGKMIIEDKVQAATIILTYADKNEKICVLLVRNHPLTRGASSDISRPFYRFFNVDTLIPAFQFPGGSVSMSDAFASGLKKIFIQKQSLFDLAEDKVMRALIVGATRELHEETGLAADELPEGENSFFKYVTNQDKKDATRDFWIKLHVFNWHLGRLSQRQISFIQEKLNVGHDICAGGVYPLSSIVKHVKNAQEIFSLISGSGSIYKTTQPLNGLHHSYYTERCVLEEPERYAALVPENVVWLNQCFNIPFQLYQFPSIIPETEFERIKPIGSGTHDTQLSKHIPTNNYYVLKYIKPKSELDKQIQANAKALQLSVAAAEEDIARNELLAAELYKLHGILVPKLQLVKTPVGFIVASEYQADYKEDNYRLENTPPENLFDGVGCDLAFANYDAIGNVYKLKFFNQATVYHRPYNAGFIKNNTEVIRIDVGGSLRYRAKGALKNDAGFSEKIDIDFAFRKDINPGFYNVYANQMNINRWQRAKQRLEIVSDAQRTACVLMFAFGNSQQKQALADRINKRVANTIGAIERHIVNLQPPSLLNTSQNSS